MSCVILIQKKKGSLRFFFLTKNS